MSSTLTLTAVANWALPILKMQPLSVTNTEPALTNGNIVLGTMLAPPFRWRFNRNVLAITCVPKVGSTPAQGDYSLAIPDFGTLEDTWLTNPTNGEVMPLTGRLSLPYPTGTPGRPIEIAAQGDDNAGNITFRLNALPGQAYQIAGDYQKKMVPLITPASRFEPVPDEFAHVYQWGFLALSSLLVNDSRFPRYEQYFISRLLSLQDGLSEMERNIFVGNWQALVATMQRGEGRIQAGTAARNV